MNSSFYKNDSPGFKNNTTTMSNMPSLGKEASFQKMLTRRKLAESMSQTSLAEDSKQVGTQPLPIPDIDKRFEGSCKFYKSRITKSKMNGMLSNSKCLNDIDLLGMYNKLANPRKSSCCKSQAMTEVRKKLKCKHEL